MKDRLLLSKPQVLADALGSTICLVIYFAESPCRILQWDNVWQGKLAKMDTYGLRSLSILSWNIGLDLLFAHASLITLIVPSISGMIPRCDQSNAPTLVYLAA